MNPQDAIRAAQVRELARQGWTPVSIARLLLMTEREVRRLLGLPEKIA